MTFLFLVAAMITLPLWWRKLWRHAMNELVFLWIFLGSSVFCEIVLVARYGDDPNGVHILGITANGWFMIVCVLLVMTVCRMWYLYLAIRDYEASVRDLIREHDDTL